MENEKIIEKEVWKIIRHISISLLLGCMIGTPAWMLWNLYSEYTRWPEITHLQGIGIVFVMTYFFLIYIDKNN